MTEFTDTHERLGRMHGYVGGVSGPFDPSPLEEPMPPVVSGALLAILTRLAESQERQERKLDGLIEGLKARGAL